MSVYEAMHAMVCVVFFLIIISFLQLSQSTRDVQTRYRVVVVGAGVSGYSAAATLLDHNVTDLVVLEASDRIGGRIHTVQFGGVTIDKGAEYCHGEVDNAVYQLVGSYDLLASYAKMLQSKFYTFTNTSGYLFNYTQVKQLWNDLYKIMHGEDLKNFNGSLADYFVPRLDNFTQENEVDQYLKEALQHLVSMYEKVSSAADDLSQMGAWGLTEYWDCDGDLTLKWKNGSGGYNTIFSFLSKKYPNPANELPVEEKIVFGKQVTRVERKEEEVEVTCADGSTYLADHVIVTVSLGVLKKHAADMFHPALPVDKTAAIEALGFGCVGKVLLLFPYRWWPADTNVICPLFSRQELIDMNLTTTHTTLYLYIQHLACINASDSTGGIFLNEVSFLPSAIKSYWQGSWTPYLYGFNPVMNHDRMLYAWFVGNSCRKMENLTGEQVVEGLMELLNKLVGKNYNIPQPEAILKSNWCSDLHTLGSYSFRTVKSDQDNITNDDLARPVLSRTNKPMLLFAGEATHPHYFSTVHGAIETGRREAYHIINYIDNT